MFVMKLISMRLLMGDLFNKISFLFYERMLLKFRLTSRLVVKNITFGLWYRHRIIPPVTAADQIVG